MSATGDYIREAREQKGLTLGQVEEATRIPRHYLELLEGAGDDRLVSDRLYMVHFLRNYATFLEVEAETLAAQFVRENRHVEAVAEEPLKQEYSSMTMVGVAIAALLVLVAGIYVLMPGFVDFKGPTVQQPTVAPTPTTTPKKDLVAQPLPFSTSILKSNEADRSVLQPEADEATPPPSASTAATVLDANEPIPPSPRHITASETNVVTGVPGPSTSPTVNALTTKNLTIVADEKSWLRVWVDDERSKDMLLEPGETATLSARTGFVITFGNAGGVRLSLNRKELPRVGTSGQVVRRFKLPRPGQGSPR